MKKLYKNSKSKSKLSYNPDDVNIRLQHFRISELVHLISQGFIEKDDFDILTDLETINSNSNKQFPLFDDEIDIYSEDDLQRNPDLWNKVQKSQFIESLMIKLPIPLFYFDGSRKPWRVIDGLQRLHTVIGFINGNFYLSGLEYLIDECDGYYFDSIPGYLRTRILDAEVIAYVINPGTPPDVKYNIFKRINTGGLKLNGQEIRNAFFRGLPSNFIKALSSELIFKLATNKKVPSRRMVDREYVNRFIAFQIFDYKEYNGKMDAFLSDAMMDLYDRSDYELQILHSSFLESMERAYKIFKGYTFYRPKETDSWGRLPNKAVFDMWAWNLIEISEEDFAILLKNLRRFKFEYFDLMRTNQALFKSVNDTTGSKTAVLTRFSTLQFFIRRFINDYKY